MKSVVNPASLEVAELMAQLESDAKMGLSSAKAAEKLAHFGENRLAEKKKKSLFARFMAQFKDVMILILLLAAGISFGLAVHDIQSGHGSPKEFIEPGLILLIVVLNAVIGVFQESKAEKALDALKKLSAPHARVIRDGKEQKIDAALLVPGDVILLEAGDFVPADARLLESAALKAEESALTGESVPAEKDARVLCEEDAPLGDRHNMVFSGCSVTYGTGRAIVTGTGMNTEMGKIAGLLAGEKEESTPLQAKLAQLGTWLGIAALAICAIIFVIGLVDKIPVMEIFMTAVSLAVSAIPEGLPAIVTVVLSMGVQRMVKRNAIIRRLPAVETLGSASVICSDKTGTLTQNRMTLQLAWADGMENPEAISSSNSSEICNLLKYATLCCDGSVVEEKDGSITHNGDPTETAIVLAAKNNKMPKEDLNRDCPRMAEIPFDSDRKRMSVVNFMDGKYVVIVKGAFDSLAQRCISGDLEKARLLNDKLGSDALRVLAVAYKVIDEVPRMPDMEELESDLTFYGLVGMIDPPRPEARDAVTLCRKAGIRPVKITGDHVVTASAIARSLGILQEGDEAITGAQLDEMSEEELLSRVEKIGVYARVSPENKIRIVKAWQAKGQVVAMTGDGVNDAPALKAADIGCAMGITGTDVAKGAADMTRTDDNFATIVDAVQEGRGIYDNIKKVVGFLLGTNIGEVLTVFFSMLLFGVSPLVSMQLLWINLVTDSLPAIALGTEPVEKDVMDRKPKPKNESIFAHKLGLKVALQGVMFAVLTLSGFYLGQTLGGSLEAARTMAFVVLALCQLVQAYNMRSEHSLFAIGFFGNKRLNWSVLISLLLVCLVVFVPPLASAFALTMLDWWMYLIALGLALIPLPVMEIAKAVGLVRHQKDAK